MIPSISRGSEEAVVLQKGQPSPYIGVLLPELKAKELYNDINRYKLLTESYERSIILYKQNEDLYNKKSQLLLEQNDKLAEDLLKARSTSNWEKVLWFSLGFFSVVMGIYGVKATSTSK